MAISVVQHLRQAAGPSPISKSVTVSAGSTLILLSSFDTNNTITITDTSGSNSWSALLGGTIRASGVRGRCFVAYNVAGGTYTVTATNAGGGFLDFEIFEVTGLVTASAFDVFVGTTTFVGASAASDTGVSAATAQANELAVTMVVVDTNTTVTDNGSGYTYVDTGTQDMTAGYKILSAAGTQEALATLGASVGWGAGLWTFKGASVANLYASIDEASTNDADYIVSSNPPSNDTCRVKLGAISTPGAGTVSIFVRHVKP